MNLSLLLEKITYRLSPQIGAKQRLQLSRQGTLKKMIALNEKRKIFYTVIPKAANSTIKRIIWSDFPTVHTLKSLHRDHPTTSINELTDKKIDNILDDSEWLKFSFVRNPYTRVVSAYQDKIINTKQNRNFLKRIQWEKSELPTFDEFIAIIATQQPNEMDWHWQPQHCLLMLDIINYQFIGKIENFNEEFIPVLDRFTLDKKEAEKLLNLKLNVTPKSESKEQQERIVISEETAQIIQHIYKEDFSYFKYDINTY